MALAGAGQRDAVPVVINSITELPASEAAAAEDYLLWLAQDRPPKDLAPGDGEARRKRRDAWVAWWAAHGARAEPAGYEAVAGREGYLGNTVLIQPQNNQVIELGPDGKERWKLTNLQGPMDAVVLRRNRILVAESDGQRVTERNFAGEILWQATTPGCWPVG